MAKLNIITSTEYYMNTPSVFTRIGALYVGCQIYPQRDNYPPNIEHWQNSECSDSGRFFNVQEKEFTLQEIERLLNLQAAINSLKKIIPNQPTYRHNPKNWRVKRGAEYQKWLEKETEWNRIISEYFKAYSVYDDAISRAFSEIRNILTKDQFGKITNLQTP